MPSRVFAAVRNHLKFLSAGELDAFPIAVEMEKKLREKNEAIADARDEYQRSIAPAREVYEKVTKKEE